MSAPDLKREAWERSRLRARQTPARPRPAEPECRLGALCPLTQADIRAGSDYVRAVRPAAWYYSLRLIGVGNFAAQLQSLLTVNKPTLIKDISGAGALHPMSAAPAVSMSVRGRPRFPLRVLGNRIRESQ